ncbi:hypothetical protein ACGCUP_00835 [Eubacteriales bacterium KG125]
MKRLTINEVLTDNRVVEYRGYATKNNGIEVDITFTPAELEAIVKKVEKQQTKEELTQNIIDKALIADVAKGNIVDIRLTQEWRENTKYLKDQPVNKFGVLYYANKEHVSDNQSNPIFDTETWRKEVKKVAEDGANPEYTKNIGSAKAWNRDETFEKGVYVKWYGDLYKATDKIIDNSEPGKDDKWEKIEKLAKEE